MGWFEQARFGAFVHWGHASVRGLELSWPLVGGLSVFPCCQDVPAEDYHRTASTFSPAPGSARRWAALARRAGMEYAILTAKHHDGFALFDTQLSDFSVVHAPYGRDLVAEFVEAVCAEGLRVGLYFSLSDWHHPDYPPFRDADRPYSFGQRPRPTAEQWQRFVGFLHGQVRELLTGYGRIDVLWFDGGWERTADEWQARALDAMIRVLQPEIVVNDRLPGCGDYDTPEQVVPGQAPSRAWETCLTMNESWGWNPTDTRWKSARQLIHVLCEVAGKGGKLLLNVSPMGDGGLPVEQVERLETMAGWLDRHGESIFGTTPGLEPWQFAGPSTRRGNRIYLHLLMRPYESVTVRGLPLRRVKAVHLLGVGTPLEWSGRSTVVDALFNPDPTGEMTIQVPEMLLDPAATVIAVDVAD